MEVFEDIPVILPRAFVIVAPIENDDVIEFRALSEVENNGVNDWLDDVHDD